jgi:hypothetical protein
VLGERFNPDGNERLTAVVGLTLIVLSGVEYLTLLLGLQHFLSWHIFIGFVLLPPIALKLASTGWRFVQYYLGDAEYRRKGPPQVVMRLLAPLLVAFTVLLFGSGIAIGLVDGHALQLARRVHGPAAFGWTVLLGLHVLVYLRRALRGTGVVGRVALAAAVLAGGFALGVATLPVDHDWLQLPPKHEHERPAPASKQAPAAVR